MLSLPFCFFQFYYVEEDSSRDLPASVANIQP